MTGPAVDIFKQTIAGHSLDDLLAMVQKRHRVEASRALRMIWAAFAQAVQQHTPAYVPLPVPGALPEIRHTDKIEVKRIEDGFAEVSETKWQDLKLELFRAGSDDSDVRTIAKALASGQAYTHRTTAAEYEYRKVQA
jgi:hypothetical protein